MITIEDRAVNPVKVILCHEDSQWQKGLSQGMGRLFEGKYLQSLWKQGQEGELILFVGMGAAPREKIHLKEVGAKAARECKEKKIQAFSVDMEEAVLQYGLSGVRHITEGLLLGSYEEISFKKQERAGQDIVLYHIPIGMREKMTSVVKETETLVTAMCFARDMVNLPGNHLRPMDFGKNIMKLVEKTAIDAKLFTESNLEEKGFHALLAVGKSSSNPPCMLVLRYQGNPESDDVTGLVGKGVTCDTGGYCLKASRSMSGIRGDMAGGAAVAGAIYALAEMQVKTNVVAVIPMCENRISPGSLLTGDVIGSYSGRTIEIGNTDAEGRLILADAVSYAVREEHASRIVDIATLTGAVVDMLGFTVAGAVCDDDSMFEAFQRAYERSGERYWRLPFYEEHEKMIESRVADVSNVSSGCGTIAAGLFIRQFADGKPWLHLDIAGTAWVNTPIFQFHSIGATGAGVTSLYEFCKG